MMQQNNQKPSTSTQIRTMYSDGMSSMNIKFYNTSLSFNLYPFVGQDQNGIPRYDTKNGQQTTVNFEGAYALYRVANDIIQNKVQQTSVSVPCNGAILLLERKLGMGGKMETVFSISKNNVTIPFKFKTIPQNINTNGQIQTQEIEVGLGAFAKTIEGYLTGINAERHLNKLTDDYAKLQQGTTQQAPQQQPQQQEQRPQYNKNYNNNNKRRYQNNFGNNNYQQPQQNYSNQSFGNYQIQN